MKLILRNKAAATREGSAASSADLKALDGWHYVEEPLSEHLDIAVLAGVTIEGGDIKLVYDAERSTLEVVTEYSSSRKLTKKQAEALIQYTEGQWGDGVGEHCFGERAAALGLELDLLPGGTTTIEQLEEKPNNAPKKTSRLPQLAEKGNLAAIKTLLEKGDDIETPNKWGQSPLYIALANGHANVAELLLEKGASPNCPGMIHVAAMMGLTELVGVLLDRGVPIDERDDRQMTALMWAANRAHIDVVRLLLSRGSDASLRDGQNETALMYASPSRPDIIELLRAAE